MSHACKGSEPASSSSRWNHVKYDFSVQCLGEYRCSVTNYNRSWHITCIHSRFPYSQNRRCTPNISLQLVAYCNSIQCVQQHSYASRDCPELGLGPHDQYMQLEPLDWFEASGMGWGPVECMRGQWYGWEALGMVWDPAYALKL